MALDYSSIPATSVDVERVFSRGRILLSHLRNRLSPRSTQALLCLGDWVQKGLITDRDFMIIKSGDLTTEEAVNDVD
ncbi:hypothetical protein H0H92_006346 [Tricholoma furcatifolium]|nr:hypothetical protein H0H92_006346 [Tricholoma furcatifolium]